MENIIPLFESRNSNITRHLNEDLSVRKGKYGLYIFYKTSDMSKPKFYNIKKTFPNKNIDTLSNHELISIIKQRYIYGRT